MISTRSMIFDHESEAPAVQLAQREAPWAVTRRLRMMRDDL